MEITLKELEAKLLEENLKSMFKQAYEQGVKDAQKRFSYPHVLTKQHLAEIFQVKMPTVNKIIAHPSFPKFTEVSARYPRDQVFMWIDDHSTYFKDIFNKAS